MSKKTNYQTFTLIDEKGNAYDVDCYTTRTSYQTTEHALCSGCEGKDRWINRPWHSFDYENALYDLAKKMSGRNKARFEAFKTCIEAKAKSVQEATNAWLNKFKKDYKSLSDTTKKHLANADIELTSVEQAEDVMRISKVFDEMFRLVDGKEGE